MVIDWSATAAWIALIVAIISPVANTVIQGLFDRQKTVFTEEAVKKRDSYSRYLSSVSSYLGHTTFNNLEEYHLSLGIAALYLSKEELEVVEELDNAIEEENYQSARIIYYQKVIPCLQRSLSSQKKPKAK